MILRMAQVKHKQAHELHSTAGPIETQCVQIGKPRALTVACAYRYTLCCYASQKAVTTLIFNDTFCLWLLLVLQLMDAGSTVSCSESLQNMSFHVLESRQGR